MMKRSGRSVTGILLLFVGVGAGSCGGPGGGTATRSETVFATHLPDGYALRLDRDNRSPANFMANPIDGGLEVETGPAGIIYRPDQRVESGRYTVRASFTEIDAPVGHREGFGLFIGGQDLESANQRYTYFLVRSDGRYLIKRRDGDSAPEVSDGWQASDAIRVPASDSGDVINELAVAVDEGRLRFSCNGELVDEIPIGDLSAHGVVGFRVNHNVAVRIQDLRIER